MENGIPAQADTDPQVDTGSVDYEKRYKDTQASFTTSQQRVKELEAERDVLRDLVPDPLSSLPEEVRDELEDLKYSDPEAWRTRLNEVEVQARTQLNERITETTSKATSEAAVAFELSRRSNVLEEFNRANSANPLTDEQLANDIPPRLTKKLEAGEITFEDLLQQAHQYVNAGRAFKTDTSDMLEQPNMNSTSGRADSSDHRPDKTASKKYANSYY